jgi:cytochrome c
VKRTYAMIGIIVLAAGVALAKESGQTQSKKKGSASAGSAAKGKELFDQKCAVCHYANSDEKKIGPGLKGLYKRGKFTVNSNKVTDENLSNWIENGDSLMPPFKDVLTPAQIKDVVAYVKTL